MFCKSCGNQISGTFCSKCGTKSDAPQASSTIGTRDQKRSDLIFKNPPPSSWVAAWSFLLPGLSQLILGQVAKGLMYMGIVILLGIFLGGALGDATYGLGMGASMGAFFDARKAIQTLRLGKPITKWGNVPPADYSA
jgi:hypothetical protein